MPPSLWPRCLGKEVIHYATKPIELFLIVDRLNGVDLRYYLRDVTHGNASLTCGLPRGIKAAQLAY